MAVLHDGVSEVYLGCCKIFVKEFFCGIVNGFCNHGWDFVVGFGFRCFSAGGLGGGGLVWFCTLVLIAFLMLGGYNPLQFWDLLQVFKLPKS